MSNVPGYENTDPNVLAKQAEQDLNSFEAKQGHHGPGHAGKGAGESSKFPHFQGFDILQVAEAGHHSKRIRCR